MIFDEVITGFRLAFGGAAAYFGVMPDLVTYGKIIGGGMPVGAYGGRREIMENVSPMGSVYQAGTLSGNPIAMTAGIETLKQLLSEPEIYDRINEMGAYLADGLRRISGFTVNNIGSLVCMFYTKEPVADYDSACKSDTVGFSHVFRELLAEGHLRGAVPVRSHVPEYGIYKGRTEFYNRNLQKDFDTIKRVYSSSSNS